MKKIVIILIFLMMIGVGFLSGCNEDKGDTFPDNATVLTDSESIQEAIDSASVNDTIYISKGIYFENIEIKKSIKLIGEDKNTTIIYGNGSGTVIIILADHVNISGFTITNGGPVFNNNDAGIRIKSNYNTLSNCIISSNRNFGLYLSGYFITPYNKIKNNIFSNNIYGIYADGSKTNNISSNIFIGNTEYAIYLLGQSDNNTIFDNIFRDNNYAIRIKSSTLNKVIKNLIINNTYGVFFCCGAKNNIVYYNDFVNNKNWSARDDPINIWDNGIIGNYWDDYTGIDANADGIGDVPYNIKNGKEDRFPLMQPILKN